MFPGSQLAKDKVRVGLAMSDIFPQQNFLVTEVAS
jgi:hypothetical protein